MSVGTRAMATAPQDDGRELGAAQMMKVIAVSLSPNYDKADGSVRHARDAGSAGLSMGSPPHIAFPRQPESKILSCFSDTASKARCAGT